MADRVVIESYEEAVAWLRIAKDSGSWQIAPAARDILAVLEREHEEAELLRAGLHDLMVSLTFETPPTERQWGRIREAASTWLVNDAARKGVSDE